MDWFSLLDTFKQKLPSGDRGDFKYQVRCVREVMRNTEIMKNTLDYVQRAREIVNGKSNVESFKYRSLGNEFYKSKDLDKALFYYSNAIIYGEQDTEHLFYAYSNRSATLYHKFDWELCIKDTEKAIEIRPSVVVDKQFILYKRLAECLIHLNKIEKALEVISHMDSELTLNEKQLAEFNEFKDKIKGRTESKSDDNYIDVALSAMFIGNDIYSSSQLNMRKINGYRGIYCNRDIEAGQLLFIEPAYASVTLNREQDELFFCDSCGISTKTPVPCPGCSEHVYCANECQVLAWEKYHKWECLISQHGFWKTVGIAHLASRLLFVGLPTLSSTLYTLNNKASLKLEEISELLKLITTTIDSKACSYYKSPSVFNYAFLLSLVDNIQELNKEDFYKYLLTAVMITLQIHNHTKFVDHVLNQNADIGVVFDDWITLIAVLLLQHIGKLICNASSISIYKPDPSSLENFSCVGSGIYPMISVMNHSCNSNIVTSFVGSKQVVKARYKIKKDEEIFNCYGTTFRTADFEQRQFWLLNQYHFKCECIICSNPHMRDFSKTFFAYKCMNCKGTVIQDVEKPFCMRCGVVDLGKTFKELEKLRKKFDSLHALTNENEKDQITLICYGFERNLHKNNNELLEIYKRMSEMCFESGYYEDAIHYYDKYITLSETICGDHTFEVAEIYYEFSINILMKYLKHLANANKKKSVLYRLTFNKLKFALKKALFIYELYFCVQFDKIGKIKYMLRILNN